ncbi:trichohyalin-like [Belonocnema kinseyi]|uniref:trichohyalin-like n=1 Tax=Belonocnema kinseyi TaxID=2817044 RepID=UPI00143D04E2|nr:trichohyalin-like [Belonocnema kinseyi]
MKKQGEEVKDELRKVSQKWAEWDQLWNGEKEKVWNELECIENRQRERENEEVRKRDMKLLEERERESKIELSNKSKMGEKGSMEEVRECEVVKREQNERWRLRLIEAERRMEGEERAKRKKNIIVKGFKVDSERAEEEIMKVMRDIGAQFRLIEIRRLGGNKEGRESMFLVNLGSEQDKNEVIEKKKLLKRRNERIEEDLMWRKKRRKLLIERKTWAEKCNGNRVRIER